MPAVRTIFLSAVLLGAACYAANSQERCLEGRGFDGKCTNPKLAQVMRQSTIIATQPKISYTAPLNLPVEDRFYVNSPQRYEYIRLFAVPATRYASPTGVIPVNPVTMP
jgi:hypothetical protein